MIRKLLPPLLLALFFHTQILYCEVVSSNREIAREKSAGDRTSRKESDAQLLAADKKGDVELTKEELASKDGKLKYFAPLSKAEKKNIDFIMSTITKKPFFTVLSEEKRLDRAGEKIKNVSSLRFWKEVLTDDSLKKELHNTGYIVKKKFIAKAAKKWEQAYREGELKNEQFEDFSKATGIPLKEIQKYTQKKNWKGLLEYFFNQK